MSNKEQEQALLAQTTAAKRFESYACVAREFDLWATGVGSFSLSRRHLRYPYDADVELFNYRAPEELAALVLSLLQNHEDMRTVFDIGCGTGRVGKPFLERGYAVDGIDISSVMMEKAIERGYRNLTQHNIATTPFETTVRYDAAISVGVLGDYVPPDCVARNFVHAFHDRAVIGVAGEMTEEGIFGLQTILKNEEFQEAHFHVGFGYQHSSKNPIDYAYMVFTRDL